MNNSTESKWADTEAPQQRVFGDMEPPASMPVGIAKGIAKVMKSVRQLGKDERNQYGKYDYVSVDKFYAAMGPLIADAGIFVVPYERDREIVSSADGKSNWLRIKFAIMVYEADSGEGAFFGHWTVEVQANGPQASASARSFVTKYFLRNLFQIPTGDDDDADALPHGNLPESKDKKNGGDQDDAKVAAAKRYAEQVRQFLDTNPTSRELLEWEAEQSKKRGNPLKRLREDYRHIAGDVLDRIEAIYEASKDGEDDKAS